jgi:hypothetical protein
VTHETIAAVVREKPDLSDAPIEVRRVLEKVWRRPEEAAARRH